MELHISEKEQKKILGPTICLNMIVKNESKVITRMFDALVDIIDCYCICDTGSSDNTVEIITNYFLEKGITGKIVYEPFKNFAHNRNVALQSCKGMSDYVLLLDADMILKISDKFVKTALKEDFYFLFQGNESFYYQNVRIVRNNGLFSYSGVTHEHINSPPRSIGGKLFDKKIIFIHDIGDGGSKSDKFKRDIMLLEQGLIDEPNNTRYMFYLGNSYRDYGDDDKAIETYKKQLSTNAWIQEKYCACLSIGNIYFKKGDKVNAAKFWLKTSEYDNERIEGIVKAMDYYRNEGENILVNFLYHKYKGYKRNLAEGKLFVEQDKYMDMLEFNNSISAYYANDKESGYECCKQILLRGIMDLGNMKKTLENMRFYKDFLLKAGKDERDKIFTCVDKLLDLLNEKKNEDEIWSLLHKDKFTIDEVSIDEVSIDKVSIEKVSIDEVSIDEVSIDEVSIDEMNLEEVYQKIKQLRIHSKSQEAMNLYKSISKDHRNYSDYLWKLEYEYSVFGYYTGLRNINQQIVTILNKCDDNSLITSVLSNMKFYPDILESEKKYDFTFSLKHKINEIEYNFNSSSSSIIPYNDGYLLNVRLVNYEIDSQGSYTNCDKHIISLYKSITLSKDFIKINETLIDVDYADRLYMGIEDVRIFQDSDKKIIFTGTGYHNTNNVGVVYGQYSEVNYICGKPLNSIHIKPEFNLHSSCEKNWTYVKYKDETHIIYNWFPLKICKVNKPKIDILELVEERTMPAIFRNARGSSCGSTYKDKLGNDEVWFIVHLVSYEKPRYYYHMLAIFDVDLNLLRYSAPFKFEGECIEYCIGLIIEEERVIIPYSTMDRTTKLAVYSKDYIESKIIYRYISEKNKNSFLADDKHFHRDYDSNKNYILNARQQLLSTIDISNVIPDNILNAVIITGQIRTLEKILKSLVTNIIVPNNAIVFISCETGRKEELYKILNTYSEIKIGGIIVEETFRNEEFNSIVNMIKSSNRKGLSNDIFERAKKADGINWNMNYIETSGSVIQYYQFWKIWNILLDYERKQNCKFVNIIRTRTDVFITKEININNVFEEEGYIKNLYDKSLLLSNSIYFDKLTNIISNQYDTVITLGTEQVWIGKRSVFDRLSNIIFYYGLWDSGHSFSFNSETTFHEFCKNNNLYHIGIQEKEDWPLYFYGNHDYSVNKYLFGICRI